MSAFTNAKMSSRIDRIGFAVPAVVTVLAARTDAFAVCAVTPHRLRPTLAMMSAPFGTVLRRRPPADERAGGRPDERVDRIPHVIDRRNLVGEKLDHVENADGDQHRCRRKKGREIAGKHTRLPSRQRTEHEQRCVRVDPGADAETGRGENRR